jgi:hypothetical protein
MRRRAPFFGNPLGGFTLQESQADQFPILLGKLFHRGQDMFDAFVLHHAIKWCHVVRRHVVYEQSNISSVTILLSPVEGQIDGRAKDVGFRTRCSIESSRSQDSHKKILEQLVGCISIRGQFD